MSENKYFKTYRDKSGTQRVKRMWTPAYDPKEDAEQDKFRPPPMMRQDFAVNLTLEIAETIGIAEPLSISVLGGKWTECNLCGVQNLWSRQTCKECGAKMVQPIAFNSQVWYERDSWQIRLARDCTQFKKLPKQLKTIRAYQDMGRDDPFWVTYTNVIWALSPMLYARLQQRKYATWDHNKFGTGMFKEFQHKTHVTVARQTMEYFNYYLNLYV